MKTFIIYYLYFVFGTAMLGIRIILTIAQPFRRNAK